MNYYILMIVISLFILTVLTRALPFLFTEKLADNVKLKMFGKRLTSYIIMLLVIYEITPQAFTVYPFGLPALIGLLVVILVHLFLHKPLLSMILGTASYILLNMHYTL